MYDLIIILGVHFCSGDPIYLSVFTSIKSKKFVMVEEFGLSLVPGWLACRGWDPLFFMYDAILLDIVQKFFFRALGSSASLHSYMHRVEVIVTPDTIAHILHIPHEPEATFPGHVVGRPET